MAGKAEIHEDDLDDEAEARESYPFLYEDTRAGDEAKDEETEPEDARRFSLPPEFNLPPDKTVNYHWIHELTDDLLPNLDFYRFDNMFGARPARAFFEGNASAAPAALFGNFWRAGEMAIFFADTGTGKSLLAVQIGQAIASGVPLDPFATTAPAQRVVYFDLELTDLQFARRYTSDDARRPAHFPFHGNFIRAAPRVIEELPDEYRDLTQYLVASLVEFIEFSLAKVVIIDNVTWLNNSSQIGSSAARVMKVLQRLKKELGLSILVLAHTPKRPLHAPVTINDLQGSKMLSNFADSVFAMGTSRLSNDLRYLKSIKHRSNAGPISEAEVATVRLVKDECFLGFRFEEMSDERDHVGWVRSPLEPERVALARRAAELVEKNFSQREIALKLGVSPATVNRCLKALKT
ncbi:MAG: AAA family ATPase [Chloracidobacterium sp.]|nr:AAA family ATPase [Chloracidobacterium sp.]